jgi:hypothetical protein
MKAKRKIGMGCKNKKSRKNGKRKILTPNQL